MRTAQVTRSVNTTCRQPWLRQIVEVCGHFGMLEPVTLLVDGERALYQRLRLGQPVGFALTGTGKAMYALLECVKTLQPGSVPDYKMVPPVEAAVMLSNLFNAARIQGWRLDPPKQNQEWINFRLASGATGFFRAARGLGTRSADEHATFVIGKLSELCKGSFLSGKQSEPSTDGSVVRKVVTTCRGESKGDVYTETTIIRQADGFLMELSHFMPVPPLGGSDASVEDPSKGDRAAIVDAALRMGSSR